MKNRLVGMLLFIVGIFVLYIGMKDRRMLQEYENAIWWNYVVVYGIIIIGIIVSAVGYGILKRKT